MRLRIPPVLALKGASWGDWEGNRYRLEEDTPVRLSYQEPALPGYVIAYSVADGQRMHIKRRSIINAIQQISEIMDV